MTGGPSLEAALGSVDVGSFYCKAFSPTTYFGPCLTPYGNDLNTQVPNSSKYSGIKSRANSSWKATDDVLVYYTWSRGFRPGGFNRGSSGHLKGADGQDQYFTPITYAPYSLNNSKQTNSPFLINNNLRAQPMGKRLRRSAILLELSAAGLQIPR